jgi:hypothetical protein
MDRLLTPSLDRQISGSEDFKVEYEEARKAKEEADESSILAYQKRKTQLAERKQIKEQKDEAERYNEKTKVRGSGSLPISHMIVIGPANACTLNVIQHHQRRRRLRIS